LARTTPDGLFTFLQVYDAGHMVPSDQPQVALEMIRNFVTRGKF
jgi:cathepsin A (carboxypeptidase C)